MNLMKFRPLFLFISSFLIVGSLFSIIKWGFELGLDFSGGSFLEFSYATTPDKDKVRQVFSDQSIATDSLSCQEYNCQIKFGTIDQPAKSSLEESLESIDASYQTLRFETLGPSLGRELVSKTITAIIFSSILLLLFIASRFRDWTFGVSAIIAMLHDAFILLGSLSLLGHFFGAELDALFVTALLTTLSASVHDTIVTFDRIRELRHTNYKQGWVELADRAVSEVIVRSINNSLTIIFMLTALVVLGGDSTRWFATSLLIGVVSGTYSSIGVAIPFVLFFKRKQK